jgi:transcriptional regulator with XRE-family HTH domain
VTELNAPERDVLDRIAIAFRSRREELGLTRHELAARGGPSIGPIARFEGNKRRWPKTAAIRTRWALALGWEPDAWERVARGEKPQESESDEIDEILESLETDVHRLRGAILRRRRHIGGTSPSREDSLAPLREPAPRWSARPAEPEPILRESTGR